MGVETWAVSVPSRQGGKLENQHAVASIHLPALQEAVTGSCCRLSSFADFLPRVPCQVFIQLAGGQRSSSTAAALPAKAFELHAALPGRQELH